MAKKIFTFRGITLEDLNTKSYDELSLLLTSSARRKIKRGFTDSEKIFLEKLRKKSGKIKTHCRDMIILPQMVGRTINVYTGKDFVPIEIQDEMIGHRLGEFALTRKRVGHNAPGVGATRSSSNVSVR